MVCNFREGKEGKTLDLEKHLILLKGQDVTGKIETCSFHEANNKWQITYAGSDKIYTPNRENLIWHENPIQMAPDSVAVYDRERLIADIEKIIDFGQHVRLIFKYGAPKLYHKNQISFDAPYPQSQSAQDVLKYLKQLSAIVSLKDEKDRSFLSREYEKMTVIHRNSVLSSYLKKDRPKNLNYSENLIYPFGFNLSQKSAVKSAFASSVSIIEGPPGTGKTQTILNIIANAVLNKQAVAVVSNNNYATLNVYEKLKKYDLDFLCAYLGKNENRDKFFNELQQNPRPDIGAWVYSNYNELKNNLSNAHHKLDEMLADQNASALLKQLLDAIQVEKHYFDQYYIETQTNDVVKDFRLKRADQYLSLLFQYQRLKADDKKINLLRKFYNLFVYSMRDFSFYDMPSEKIISYLQKKYYEEKIKELEQEIHSLNLKLENYHFDSEMKYHSEQSMDVLKAYLAEKYNNDNNELFTNKNFRTRFQSFISQYPVVLSTTHSLCNCVQNGYLFDYVIIDESSQVDLVSGCIALSCAKNVVIVGDLKQLPNIVERKNIDAINQIWKQNNIDESYHYANNSLLSSAHKVFPAAPKTLLREHYRCHPKIIGFCNHKFYRGELITLTKEMNIERPLMVYKTVKGNHARGRYNQRQIDVVFEEVLAEQKFLLAEAKRIAVISPYRPQADALIQEIQQRGYQDKMEANTVH